MTLDEYQQAAARTFNGATGEMAAANYALGLAGEAGEVVELVKKKLFHGRDVEQDAVRKELGDVLWYLAALANQFQLTLDDVAEANVAKLKARYPEGFVQGGGIR